MSGKSPSLLIEARNQRIIDTYLNDTQVTLRYLAKEIGLSVSTIRTILQKAKIEVRKERLGRPSLMEMKPLSPGHVWIGAKLDSYLLKHSSMQELSAKIKLSTHQIGIARFGAYDFKLSDLQRISTVLALDLPREFSEGYGIQIPQPSV